MRGYRFLSLPGLGGVVLLAAAAMDTARPPDPPQRLAQNALAGPVAAVVERVVDGDTVDVRAVIWLGQTVNVRVRIEGVDAPELQARCAEERRLALAARDFLKSRLEGAEVRLSGVIYDKFGGRVRAKIADAKGDIAAALLSGGFARPYAGETRMPWCPET